MITRYGYSVVVTTLAVVAVGALLAWVFVDTGMLRFGIMGFLIVVLIFVLAFFRDPDRTPPRGESLVISPADGRVVVIREVEENEYMKSPCLQLSIFMSPFDVHVNRFPISGRVAYFKHIPGKHLVAFDEKSSDRNERTHIAIENGTTRVFFKQIAGFIARRIITSVQVGDNAIAGERFGMIRFGSRVDVIVPSNSDVKVKVGDRTVAGETVLADVV